MESICLGKKAKKLRKSIYLFNELESEKVIEFRPPLFFNFRGGHTSSTFSYSCSFLRYAFLGSKFTFQNTDFWEKSFCTAVSIPKRFHMTMEALCSEIHQPTLMQYHISHLTLPAMGSCGVIMTHVVIIQPGYPKNFTSSTQKISAHPTQCWSMCGVRVEWYKKQAYCLQYLFYLSLGSLKWPEVF